MNKYYLNEGFKLSEYGLKLEERYILTEETVAETLTKNINIVKTKINTLITTLESDTTNYDSNKDSLAGLSELADKVELAEDPQAVAGLVQQYVTKFKDITGTASNLPQYRVIKMDLDTLANETATKGKKYNKSDVAALKSKVATFEKAVEDSTIFKTDNSKNINIKNALSKVNEKLELLETNIENFSSNTKTAIQVNTDLKALVAALPTKTNLQSNKFDYDAVIKACATFSNKQYTDVNATIESNKVKTAGTIDEYWLGELKNASDANNVWDSYCEACWDGKSGMIRELLTRPGLQQELFTLGFTPTTNPFINFLEYATGIKHEWSSIKYITNDSGEKTIDPKHLPGHKLNEATIKLTNLNTGYKYDALHNAYVNKLITKADLINATKADAVTSLIYCNGLYANEAPNITAILKQRNELAKKYTDGAYKWTGDLAYLNEKFSTNENALVKAIFIDGELNITNTTLNTKTATECSKISTIDRLMEAVFEAPTEKVKEVASDANIETLINSDLFNNVDNIISGIVYVALVTDNLAEAKEYREVSSKLTLDAANVGLEKIAKKLGELELNKAAGTKIIKALATRGKLTS